MINIETLEKIGKISSKIKKELNKLVKIDISYLEIINFVENFIEKEGFIPAFPCTVCINNVAAHFTIYKEELKIKEGDLVKIDFGICDIKTGMICDTAITVEVEDNDNKKRYNELINANKEGLKLLLEYIEPNKTFEEIGNYIDKYAKSKGFTTIYNLYGHQISNFKLHSGLNVPNFKNNDKRKVGENKILAIEPFFSTGSNKVIPKGNSNILIMNNDKRIRDYNANLILNFIKKNYYGLPFAKRWLLKKFEERKVNYSINLLKKYNILYEYETLISEDNSMISQFEETIVILKNKKYIITK